MNRSKKRYSPGFYWYKQTKEVQMQAFFKRDFLDEQ